MKYKIDIINIDKDDNALVIEARLTSVKNFIVNEMNDYIDALLDLGFEEAKEDIKYIFS